MITFTLICLVLAVLIVLAVGVIALLGGALSGVLLIVLDVVIGILPFVGAFMLVRWLLKRRSR